MYGRRLETPNLGLAMILIFGSSIHMDATALNYPGISQSTVKVVFDFKQE